MGEVTDNVWIIYTKNGKTRIVCTRFTLAVTEWISIDGSYEITKYYMEGYLTALESSLLQAVCMESFAIP